MTYEFPHDLNVDLHMHSTASDGELSPEALVARAHGNQVRMMALTDHDTLGGQAQARAAAQDLGVDLIAGVEISVTWAGVTLHIVGLNFDPDHGPLNQALTQIQAGRAARAELMAQGLTDHGLPNFLPAAKAYARNPDLIGRTHFARAMVQAGVCEDMNQVFQNYLTPGKPGYTKHQWISLTQALGLIHGAGGVAVLAHPARYKLSALAQWALIQEFKALGGQAIEVVTGSHTQQETRRFQQIAVEYGLFASRGSDFHSPSESRFDVGCVPPLPDATRPVWHDWVHC
jgi:3',5'-nucleoside bisphosphate phosphatase